VVLATGTAVFVACVVMVVAMVVCLLAVGVEIARPDLETTVATVFFS